MVKKLLMLLVVAFAIFFLLVRPEGAADAVEFLADACGQMFRQVARFFGALSD